ncbi:hypothetical protein DXT76_19850 [Halobacillus trueperi]|uniref:Uncharacterized protein n=1 Tax=Halobacillus trueperi TaxID=156205 RepID=A0A3D8VCX7_9BACI|nr:hypothetical protein [Halobacillus trueperi]RDY67277.1 hypothetical protein DXT76_19850 [Halobacillus trueperi]
MDHQQIKEAINRQIGEDPLFTDKDKERFYKNKPNRRQRFPAAPKIVTVLLAFFVLSGSFYTFIKTDWFEQPSSPTQEEKEPVEETPPAPDPDPEEPTHVKVEKLKEVIVSMPSKSKMKVAIDQFEGTEVESKVADTENANGNEYELFESYYAFASRKEQGNPPAYDGPLPPPKDAFKNDEIEISMKLNWVEGGERTYLNEATLLYLSEEGDLIEENYKVHERERNFIKVKNPNEPVVMDDLILGSIARSVDKEPEAITKRDLLYLEELTINASHLSGIYEVDEDIEYFKAMQSLFVLKLNQAIIPGELLKEVPYLDQATFIGPTVDDLSRVKEGLQTITYLNLINSSFRGTAEDILELKSLNIVRVDPAVVPNYEDLQFEGMDVRW